TLLHRYCGQDDFGIATVTALRDRPELRSVVGFFANTFVLRCKVGGSKTFGEVLRDVREMVEASLARQTVPFEDVVRAAGAPDGHSLNPLAHSSFVLQS